MAFVRMLTNLLKDPAARSADRADRGRRGTHVRHGGDLFKQVGIYSSVGQLYEPEDIGSVLSYK